MYILLMRHGESVDDLTNQYGGWADFPLTPKGYNQIAEVAQNIKKLNIRFASVYTSPLIRAIESGRIVANALSIPQKILLYLKEKNGYGLLSGLNKTQAKQEYPNLVKDLDNGYVYGAEPQDKFEERVRLGFETLFNYKNNVIAVSHGGYLKTLYKQLFGIRPKDIADGGFIVLEGNSITDLKVVNNQGFEL